MPIEVELQIWMRSISKFRPLFLAGVPNRNRKVLPVGMETLKPQCLEIDKSGFLAALTLPRPRPPARGRKQASAARVRPGRAISVARAPGSP